MTAEHFETAGAQMIHRNAITAMVYMLGGLDLETSVAAKMQPSLDLHQSSSLILNPQFAGVYIAFETGKYYEMRRECEYSKMCRDSSMISAVNSGESEHNLHMVAMGLNMSFHNSCREHTLQVYNTIDDPAGSTAKLSAQPPHITLNKTTSIASLGVYDPTEHMWYQEAAAAPRLRVNTPGDQIGQFFVSQRISFPVVTPASNEFTKGGSTFVRVSQAIYSSADRLVGVVGAYMTTDAASEFLATGLTNLESEDVVIAELGDVMSSSDRLVSYTTHGQPTTYVGSWLTGPAVASQLT